MISGVFAVRPEQMTLGSTAVKRLSINTIFTKSMAEAVKYTTPTKTTTTTISTIPGAPQWLVDFVVSTVWGPEDAEKLPSPLVAADDNDKLLPPALPHLLVGCRHEMFGLNWLDLFFCSSAYRDMVQATTGQAAKYVQVESDHWNILNSTALRNALQEELPALMAAAAANNKK